jgi:dolichol-phosphate mannosyltransferase
VTLPPPQANSLVERNEPLDAAVLLAASRLVLQHFQGIQTSFDRLSISVVAPVYNEHENIAEFYRRLKTTLVGLGCSYEIILVNDGSDKQCSDQLAALTQENENLKVVELTRNFGHQKAVSCGLEHTLGQTIVVLDSDLQDPPELIPEFLEKIRDGYDVVYGIRKTRQENLLKKICYTSYYRILRKLADIDMPLDAGDFCAMTREVADNIISMPESNIFMRGLRSWVGGKQTGIEYDRDPRYLGKPKYSIRRLLRLASDGVFSFSLGPLRAITFVGFLISFFAFALALYYTLQRIQIGLNPPGFATTTVMILFFSGVQLITLGIIGEYLGRVYDEVKRRPKYLVKRIISNQAKT